jgi:hypothetical protein
MPARPGPSRPASRILLAGLALGAALAIGACSGGATTTAGPLASTGTGESSMPSAASSTGTDVGGAGTAGCVDSSTLTIINELKAPGADVPTLLTQNKDQLMSGLGKLQSTDPTTAKWRDDLIAALQSGDMAAAQAQVELVLNGSVKLTSC